MEELKLCREALVAKDSWSLVTRWGKAHPAWEFGGIERLRELEWESDWRDLAGQDGDACRVWRPEYGEYLSHRKTWYDWFAIQILVPDGRVLFYFIFGDFRSFKDLILSAFPRWMQQSSVCKIDWRLWSLQWDVSILTGRGRGKGEELDCSVFHAAWSEEASFYHAN